MVLLQDLCMLSKQHLLLSLDDWLDSLFLCNFSVAFAKLDFSLLFVNKKLFLPKTFYFTFVLHFSHSAFLSIHLLQTFVLSIFSHQFSLEFGFHTLFFSSTFSLKTELEVLSFLEFHSDTITLLNFHSLFLHCSFFTLLVVKFIAEVFLEFFLLTTSSFFCLQFTENCVTNFFSSVLSFLNLVHTLLLLLCILSDHFVFIFLHFFCTALEGSLFV